MGSSRWFVVQKPRTEARIRLYCLPYGGGGASVFREWHAALSAEIEVCAIQLPGRENRVREAPFTRMVGLVDAIHQELRGRLHGPYALFGHSLGALVAFELARRLTSEGAEPVQLCTSGQFPPDVPPLYPPIHHLADDAFISAVVARYGGIPEAVLQSPDMMRMLLPLLRADFELNETYEYLPGEPLACPITVYKGEDDPETPDEYCEGWRRHTAGAFRIRKFPGGHMFILESRRQFLQTLSSDLLPSSRN